MLDESPLPTSNPGLIHPGRCTTLNSLSFHRTVRILILTVLFLQFLGSKNIINTYYHHQREQQLQGFPSPKEGVGHIMQSKNNPSTINDIFDKETELQQKQLFFSPPPNTTLINKRGSDGDDRNNSTLWYKNITTWPISFFGEEESSTQQCWLSSIKSLLGCGCDGHAFAAIMHCHQTTDTNISVSHHKVVFKASFAYVGDVEKIEKYVSDKEKFLKKMAKYYKALMSNATITSKGGTNMRQYFRLPFGTVSVPPMRLWDAVEKRKDCGQNVLTSITTKEAKKSGIFPPPVIGTVMDYAGERTLRPKKLETPDDQRRTAKDLVCIFRHMYERNFAHRDMWYHHIYDDGEHVSLVDFNRAELLKPGDEKYNAQVQKAQLTQLMELIGSVCTKTEDRFQPPDEVRFDDQRNLADHPSAQNWTLALKQCDFVDQPSPTPMLFGHNITIAQTYQMLSRWTGGCST